MKIWESRKGITYSVLIQLLILMLLATFLLGLQDRLDQQEEFISRLYAENNALTAQTVFARTTGTINTITTYGSPYKTILQERKVVVGSTESHVDEGISAYYIKPLTAQTQEGQTNERIINWKRTDNTLQIGGASISEDECSSITGELNWERIHIQAPDASTQILIYDAIIEGLAIFPAPVQSISSEAQIRISYEEGNNMLRIGTRPEVNRLGCLLAQELALVTDSAFAQEDTVGNQIEIQADPLLSPQDLEDALRNAAQRMVPRGR